MNSWNSMTQTEQEAYIAKALGLDSVEMVEKNSVIVGDVSLVPFGLLGTIMVFRDSAGTNKAIGVPLGIGHPHLENVA